MLKIKRFYVNLIEKERKNFFEIFFYFFLYFLSLLYGVIINLRNFFFDYGILPIHFIDKKVISVGNISWGGSGKTSLVIYLHQELCKRFKVASITKGYAKDEFFLLKDKLKYVFDSKDRVLLLKRLRDDFDLFILDDGFQYRKLNRDLDIVVMGAKEFIKKKLLLPAYILREPLKSLRRADIVILTCPDKIPDINSVKESLLKINPHLKIYLADYQFKGFLDRDRNVKDDSYFKSRNFAALTAIGNPEGFISLLKNLNIRIKRVMIYPDHYEFNARDIFRIEEDLKKCGVGDVVITYKDLYHLDFSRANLNYFILEIELKIKDEANLLKDIENTIHI